MPGNKFVPAQRMQLLSEFILPAMHNGDIFQLSIIFLRRKQANKQNQEDMRTTILLRKKKKIQGRRTF
jgi:hypothetical protein